MLRGVRAVLDAVRGLGKAQLDGLASAMLARCQSEDVLPIGEVRWELFHEFRKRVHENFYVPETSITTLTSRLLFGVGCLAQPRRVVGIGTYYGNAICWLVAAGFSPRRLYDGEVAVAIDVDDEAARGFGQNAERVGLAVESVGTDGIGWLEANTDRIDLLFLDLDSPERGKADYTTCFEAAQDELAPAALVVAHDYYEEKFAEDMKRFEKVVSPRARKFMTLQTDAYGLAVAKV
jgi:predicted O-methyltransferase YrrM